MPDEVSSPAAEASPAASPRRVRREWSGLPLAASLALVAFAVLFGIYGPKVVDRSSPPLGIPVWELADDAAVQHEERQLWAQGHKEHSQPLADIETATSRILGVTVTLPDLKRLGFEPYEVRDAILPGAPRAAIVLYGRTQAIERSFVSLLLVPDREQYVVYTPFGRPIVMPPREVYPVTSGGGTSDYDTLVWSDGNLIHVLHSPDFRSLDDVTDVVVPGRPFAASEPPPSRPDRR